MIDINWKDSKSRLITFEDLRFNEAFKNAGGLGKGAIYLKIRLHDGEPAMLELATGQAWKPTRSPVERVKVSVTIDADKPGIYS